MRRWLKWPLLLVLGVLWGVAVSMVPPWIEVIYDWGPLPLYISMALMVPVGAVMCLLPRHLAWALNSYLWQSDYKAMSVLIPVHIVNVLIIYLVVVGVRRVLARRRSRREPGA
ncbi:MAG: hypothetical protein H5U02_11380 [Clostridia bacterium]|nr:hypothetical protein [Clostridia bacterium]